MKRKAECYLLSHNNRFPVKNVQVGKDSSMVSNNVSADSKLHPLPCSYSTCHSSRLCLSGSLELPVKATDEAMRG